MRLLHETWELIKPNHRIRIFAEAHFSDGFSGCYGTHFLELDRADNSFARHISYEVENELQVCRTIR